MRKTIATLSLAIAVALLLAAQSSAQVADGSFESGGFGSWGTQDLDVPFLPLTVDTAGLTPGFGLFSSAPTDGVFAALHGFDGDGATGSVSTIRIFQDVFINGTTLNFDHRHGWDLTFGGLIDRSFDVNINAAGGGANLQTTNILTAGVGTTVLDTGASSSSVDVSAFIGSTVEVSFDWTVLEDFSGPAFAQLDNVSISGVIPEPSSFALLALGTFAIFRRRR